MIKPFKLFLLESNEPDTYEEVCKKYGYKMCDKFKNIKNYQHPIHKSIISIHYDDTWDHIGAPEMDGVAASGKTAYSLDKHLEGNMKNAANVIHINHVHNKLSSNFNKYNDEDNKALEPYVIFSKNLNHALIKAKGDLNHIQDDPYYSANEHRQHIKGLDQAMKRHKLSKNIIVYSGINKAHAENLRNKADFGKSDTFLMHHPAYLSTSLNNVIAHQSAAQIFNSDKPDAETPFEKHILKIKVPKGSSGAYVGHTVGLGREREFILPRGHILNISRQPKLIKTKDSVNHYQWSATIHNPKKLQEEEEINLPIIHCSIHHK